MKILKFMILWLCLVMMLTACVFPVPVRREAPDPTVPTTQTQPQETEPTQTQPATEPSAPPQIWQEPDAEDFVRIADYIPNAKIELAYATQQNFTGKVIYDFTEAYLRYGTVKKLADVAKELATYGVGLIIWDGFRPVYAQAKLWEMYPDPTFVSHPVTGKRAHCRGNTVDISIYDLQTGQAMAMPTAFDDFSAQADRDYSDCATNAAANAKLLEQTMKKYGFNPYFSEWWHFSDSTDYPVEETFDPANLR